MTAGRYVAVRPLRSVLTSMLLALSAMLAVMIAVSPAATQTIALENLDIVTATGTHRYQVEVMRSPEQRARGLMYRRFMPEDRGMLFDFGEVAPVSMWMRNTYIPLDMVFIARDGRVASLAENTEPLSERVIPSGAPVLGVLELNAGQARKIGLKAGDRVRHPMFR